MQSAKSFQLTRSRGAWLNSSCFKYIIRQFQLTRSRGAWLILFSRKFALFYFNSHAHVERDGKTYAVCEQEINFNSHAHVERDTIFSASVAEFFNFNSHAHVERDGFFPDYPKTTQQISTHTLTWSVTSKILPHNSHLKFQLTRSRGAWLASFCQF